LKQFLSAVALVGLAALAASALPAQAMQPATVTFADGTEGWAGPSGAGGRSWLAPFQGQQRPAYRTRFSDFGISFTNSSNSDFVGDYTVLPALEIGLDVKTLALSFFGAPATRDLIVELRDYDNAPDGLPWVSVWARLGTLDPNQSDWTTLSVTIADTSATALPAGWGGYGAEDPVTYEPTLPAGRSFASVLAGVDEIAFTTFVPGYFYGETAFDVVVDNLFVRAVSSVPEPASLLLLAAGLAALRMRRR
jgi:PEP-CTERM motif